MWKVLDLEYKIESGSVIKIIAEYKIQNTINKKVFLERKIVQVELEEVEVNPNFIPFEELTEEIVIDWVKGKIDASSIEVELQSILDAKMLADQTQTVGNKLPWV